MSVFNIEFVIFPQLTQLDFTGPLQVLARLPQSTTHIVAQSTGPVPSDCGLRPLPTCRFASCPTLDLLCIPGGGVGVADVLGDQETIELNPGQAPARLTGARYDLDRAFHVGSGHLAAVAPPIVVKYLQQTLQRIKDRGDCAQLAPDEIAATLQDADLSSSVTWAYLIFCFDVPHAPLEVPFTALSGIADKAELQRLGPPFAAQKAAVCPSVMGARFLTVSIRLNCCPRLRDGALAEPATCASPTTG